MMGGFLRQFGKGRTTELRRKRACWRVATGVGLLLAAGMAGAQVASGMGQPKRIVPKTGGPSPSVQTVAQGSGATQTTLWQWQGMYVARIEFEGVTFDKTDRLPDELPQKAGEALDPQKVRESTRRLFASGRYRDISVRGVRQSGGITLIFVGEPRYYVGRVTIDGVKSERLISQLEFATKLSPGTAFMDEDVAAGKEGIEQVLQLQGYYEPSISSHVGIDAPNEQANVTYTVTIGRQARIGEVIVVGTDVGLTPAEFRKKGKLKQGNRVTRDTISNALSKLRAQYQKKDHLEATVTLQKQSYDPVKNQVDYEFQVNEGPQVGVAVEGAKVSKSKLHLLVPIFEEGTIDNDLLNEGVHNIRDYLQQQGYFDASVNVRVIGQNDAAEKVVFAVDRGSKHKVVAVELKGNKYFSDDLLRERMQVQKSNAYRRSGRYSPALMDADVSSIKALYLANGFDEATVTTHVQDVDTAPNGKPLKDAQIRVIYTINEGPQQKFGKVDLTGVDASRIKEVRSLMNAQTGQPFSLVTLSGDRDTVLQYYLSKGFDQVRVEIKQQNEAADSDKTDVALNVVEGQQVFVNKVLLSGIMHTKPSVVHEQIQVHAGDPLNQTALLETQRNLYGIALFNEVIAAVQNPAGDAPEKNVLIQLTEAKRWNVTYGFGIEAQTGTPSNESTQEGKAAVSPRVTLDVSRINLRGTDDSLSLHLAYGLLEQVALLTLQNPHFLGSKKWAGAISGGYSNVQDITTFASSTLQGDFRLTQKPQRKDTFIYDFLYRRVRVDPNSLQVSPDLIPLLSLPVRVGGPGVTWFHDTRSPSPLDATKGTYSTIQTFVASSKFGSQTNFWKVDGSNATYYRLGKYVFARDTRIGYERPWGPNPNEGNAACLGDLLTTNASCSAVPLPERLYAGGATSLRGFGINAAGPRDLQTGYPVGGTAAFVNTLELRMPPATLPYVGNNVSFVLFHDMGSVFQNPYDMFPSFIRARQPDKSTCEDVSGPVGTCSFNYFSHDVGLGARYKTPVGPIRLDFSYNLNPPIYPVISDFYNDPPHVGQAGHFNFFFSIGQTF